MSETAKQQEVTQEVSKLDKALDKVPNFVKVWISDAVEKVESKAEASKAEKDAANLRTKAKTQMDSLYSRAFLDVRSYARGKVNASTFYYLSERLTKYSKKAHELAGSEYYKKAYEENEHKREYDDLLNQVHVIDAFLAAAQYNEELAQVSSLNRLNRKQVSVLDKAKDNYRRVLKGSTVSYSTYGEAELASTVKYVEKHAKILTVPGYSG